MSERYYSKVEPGGTGRVEFSTELRRATRKIHSTSDALVNSKLILATSDPKVWSDALLIFYEVFKCLEDMRDQLNMPEMNALYVDNILNRTAAFESDIEYYLGKDWKKSYVRRKEVTEYLNHLYELKDERPMLLCAYVYHLYMGLLSGGQIIKSKRGIKQYAITRYFPFYSNQKSEEKNDIFSFGSTNITELKQNMRSALNNLAAKWTTEQRCSFINESQMVFYHNNQIIRTIRGTLKIAVRYLLYVGFAGVAIYYAISYLFSDR